MHSALCPSRLHVLTTRASGEYKGSGHVELQNIETGSVGPGAVKAYIVDMVEELAKMAQDHGDPTLAERLRDVRGGFGVQAEPS